MTTVIHTDRLTKTYGVHRGITEVDLDVEAGEIFGFLGPNGAGKTTTMRILLDLIRPTSGRAEVFGIESTRDPVAIHRRVGYLPGEFDLYDRLTGSDTIAYFANLRGGVDAGYVGELVERLDLDPSRRFKEYSKGNKQKVGLVVALQHRPDLLILDEPTSGLDPLVQQTFFELVREARSEGRTIFLSSHIIDEVDRTCDRVAIIRDGPAGPGRPDRVHPRAGVPHVELTFGTPVLPAVFEGIDGVSEVSAVGDVVRMRVSGPIGAVIAAAVPHGLVRRREPRAEPRGRVPGPVRRAAGGRRRWALTRRSRGRSARHGPGRGRGCMGLGSVYAKTVRDSRRAAIAVGLIGGLLMLATAAPYGTEFTTPESRAVLVSQMGSLPAVFRGLLGAPINIDTLGGLISFRAGNFLPVMLGLWPVIALSGTLAGEAAKGQPRRPGLDPREPALDRPPEARRARDRRRVRRRPDHDPHVSGQSGPRGPATGSVRDRRGVRLRVPDGPAHARVRLRVVRGRADRRTLTRDRDRADRAVRRLHHLVDGYPLLAHRRPRPAVLVLTGPPVTGRSRASATGRPSVSWPR